jgi:exodeoxyribonuclease VII large subunit
LSKTFLKVDFSQKDEAKRLGARWDPHQKQWYVPAGCDPAPFARWLPADIPPVVRETYDLLTQSPEGISLGELIRQVRSAVRQALPETLWVRAEIAKLDDKFSSTVFLELVERDQTREVANIKAVIWNAEPVLSQFSQQTGHPLAADMQVLVLARVEMQDRFGLRLVIDEIDPAYTVGMMASQLRAIRQTLQQEKIIDANRQRPLPDDFFKVAVISPESAAGLGDFRAGADPLQRFAICQFHYLTAIFQGPRARESLLKAIQETLALPALDALVIIRGGGAVADLHWLNELELARAICRSPIPVITGIGHQKDQTILDEVACRVEGTPSKVIALIRETIRQRAARTRDDFNTIRAVVERQRVQADHSVELYSQALRAAARRTLIEAEKTVDGMRLLVNDRAIFKVAVVEQAMTIFYDHVQTSAWRWIRWATEETSRLLREILGQGPEKTLRRGFVLVRDDAGRPVASRAIAAQQARLILEFHDGSLPVKRD